MAAEQQSQAGDAFKPPANFNQMTDQEKQQTYAEWAKQKYNEQYAIWMPWIEDTFLKYFTKDNKASYATKGKAPSSPTAPTGSSPLPTSSSPPPTSSSPPPPPPPPPPVAAAPGPEEAPSPAAEPQLTPPPRPLDQLNKTKITGIEQVDTLQDGINNTVAGQVGQGGLLQPVGDLLSKEGLNRAERGGKDEKGGILPSSLPKVPGLL